MTDARVKSPTVRSAPILQIDSVSKAYGRVQAVRDFSLSIGAGQFVALLGVNGAGKTTLFQLLSGLFASDSGQIRIAGVDAARHHVRALRGLGIVFQTPTLDLDLSPFRNLWFHAQLHGLGRAVKPDIERALARFGLSEVANRPCRELSGGNRRKVEVARALLHQPALLLMDEATTGFDIAARRSLLRDVRALCLEQRIAVLWATHLIDEAVDADQVVVLHHGRKLAEGVPDALIQQTVTEDLEAAFLKLTAAGAGKAAP